MPHPYDVPERSADPPKPFGGVWFCPACGGVVEWNENCPCTLDKRTVCPACDEPIDGETNVNDDGEILCEDCAIARLEAHDESRNT